MADTANRPICSIWGACVGSLPETRLVPNWNGNSSFPDYRPRLEARGPVDFSGLFIPGPPNQLGVKLYVTVQGVGGSCAYNFGQGVFLGPVPAGFYPGWPTEDFTGFTQLDATTGQGSAVLIGPDQVDFPTVFGLMQSIDGHRAGNFYFEYTHIFNTLDAGNIGAGVSRRGLELDFWSNAQYNVSDTNGGGKVANGNLANGFLSNIQANGNPKQDLDIGGTNGVTFGVAVSIIPPPGILIPADLHPVSMNCVPCQPIFPGDKVWKAFGG